MQANRKFHCVDGSSMNRPTSYVLPRRTLGCGHFQRNDCAGGSRQWCASPKRSRHSAQPFERALAIGEWSCSGDVVSCFVSSHETVRFLFLPVVPFPCRDGAHSFLETDKHNDCRIANHGPI